MSTDHIGRRPQASLPSPITELRSDDLKQVVAGRGAIAAEQANEVAIATIQHDPSMPYEPIVSDPKNPHQTYSNEPHQPRDPSDPHMPREPIAETTADDSNSKWMKKYLKISAPIL